MWIFKNTAEEIVGEYFSGFRGSGHRHPFLQFFKPVQDDVDRVLVGFTRLGPVCEDSRNAPPPIRQEFEVAHAWDLSHASPCWSKRLIVKATQVPAGVQTEDFLDHRSGRFRIGCVVEYRGIGESLHRQIYVG